MSILSCRRDLGDSVWVRTLCKSFGFVVGGSFLKIMHGNSVLLSTAKPGIPENNPPNTAPFPDVMVVWASSPPHTFCAIFCPQVDSSDVNLTKIFWSIFLFHFVNLYTFRNLLGKQKCFNFLPGSDDQENPSECAWIWYQVRAFSRMKGVCFWSQCNCTNDESVSLCTFPTFCLMWCSELKLETCKAPFSLIGMSAD